MGSVNGSAGLVLFLGLTNWMIHPGLPSHYTVPYDQVRMIPNQPHPAITSYERSDCKSKITSTFHLTENPDLIRLYEMKSSSTTHEVNDHESHKLSP